MKVTQEALRELIKLSIPCIGTIRAKFDMVIAELIEGGISGWYGVGDKSAWRLWL